MRGWLFKDRKEAGQLLADEIARHDLPDPVVLGLPRGGVPVAAEVATRLKAPLDIILVRKIGAPMQRELAVGAVVDGGNPEIVRNESLIYQLGLSDEEFQSEVQRQLEVIEERRARWLGARERVPVKGKTAIVIDDGIATGATIRASVRALRRQEPKGVVIATPVAPPDTVEELQREADKVICLETPEPFGAIGYFYQDFSQVSDDEVSDILATMSAQGSTASRH